MADREWALRHTVRSMRHRGLWASLAMAAEEPVGWVRYGRGSGGTHPGATLHDPDSEPLETTRFRTLRRTLAAVPADARTGGFIDLGCGRGRALLVAARMEFGSVVGVERDPDVATAARATVGPRATIIEGDATSYPIADDVTTVFLSNPFGAQSVERVIANLDASQTRAPRPLVLAYVNPMQLDLLLQAGFRVIWRDPDAIVLRRDPV